MRFIAVLTTVLTFAHTTAAQEPTAARQFDAVADKIAQLDEVKGHAYAEIAYTLIQKGYRVDMLHMLGVNVTEQRDTINDFATKDLLCQYGAVKPEVCDALKVDAQAWYNQASKE